MDCHEFNKLNSRNDEAGAFFWIATIEAIAESRNDGNRTPSRSFFGFAGMGELLRNARHAKPSVKSRNDEAGAFYGLPRLKLSQNLAMTVLRKIPRNYAQSRNDDKIFLHSVNP